jgi:hypothetical protein
VLDEELAMRKTNRNRAHRRHTTTSAGLSSTATAETGDLAGRCMKQQLVLLAQIEAPSAPAAPKCAE